jgi:hypothetical protein
MTHDNNNSYAYEYWYKIYVMNLKECKDEVIMVNLKELIYNIQYSSFLFAFPRLFDLIPALLSLQIKNSTTIIDT